MKTTTLHYKIKNLFFGLLAATLVLSCGSFQGSSYFTSDGIYVSKSNTPREYPQKNTNNNYYTQYFKNAAETGSVATASEDIYFTDSDSYVSSFDYEINSEEFTSQQLPWGDQPSQTEIILIDSRPNYFWGLSGFAFNFSPFWNSYYSNPYRFGYGRFYSRFYNYPYWNPYGAYAGFWDPFNSFYSPFNYYGGFYSPYGFGFRGHWANRFQRWNRFDDYYGTNYRRRNTNEYRTTVARIKSGRGEKTQNSSNEKPRVASKDENSKTQDIQNTINRINLGRGVNSLGRTAVVGYDRNRLNGVQRTLSGNSNSRPGTLINSRSRTSGLTQGNTNITKSSEGTLRSTNRNSPSVNRLERNPNQSSLVKRRSNRFVPATRYRVAPSSNSRTRQQGNYPNRSRTRSSSDSNSRQSNFTRSNSSNNFNRSYSRPSNSGSSRSSFSSGSTRSSSSSGRSSSSSRGGRNNR